MRPDGEEPGSEVMEYLFFILNTIQMTVVRTKKSHLSLDTALLQTNVSVKLCSRTSLQAALGICAAKQGTEKVAALTHTPPGAL